MGLSTNSFELLVGTPRCGVRSSQRDDPTTDWAEERAQIELIFSKMLRAATGDGSIKRQLGEKPPWWCDPAHEAAIFSHLNKWKHGEKKDPASGAHPLVHLAWRSLAIAYQETYGQVPP